MRRKIWGIATTGSILLLIGLGAWLVDSFFATSGVIIPAGGERCLGIAVMRGHLLAAYLPEALNDDPGFVREAQTDVYTLDTIYPARLLGFGWGSVANLYPGAGAISYLRLPLPFLIALVATGAVWCWYQWLRQRRRARDAAEHRCPGCGYDLRASPDRCPECGRHVVTTTAR